jgi:hypothetical protein
MKGAALFSAVMSSCRRRTAALTTRPSDTKGTEAPLEGNVFGRTTSLEQPRHESFVITKIVILRALGLVYFFAFLSAYWQNGALLGSDGLMPAQQYLESIRSGTPLQSFLAHPAVWWWWPLSDVRLDGVALTGVVLSAAVSLGLCSSLVLFVLWLLYFSIVTAAEGSSFYQYGWESQLLETGFLAIFLCDLAPWRLRRTSPPSPLVLWLFRWLCFRISVGAGLIKVRGSSCWTERRCLWYHFETQPIPSPLSFAFHFLPKGILSSGVDMDLFVQLYSAWTVLVPGVGRPLRWLRRAGGAIQSAFMLNIALSGNLAFLNHVTAIPALASLDDACWPAWLARLVLPTPATTPRGSRNRAVAGAHTRWNTIAAAQRWLVDLSLFATVAYLSWPVLANLLQTSGRQVMNSSFGSFRLVNSYGAFGSVGEARYEPIISVSRDGATWVELDFPCKPGNVTRRPCFRCAARALSLTRSVCCGLWAAVAPIYDPSPHSTVTAHPRSRPSRSLG